MASNFPVAAGQPSYSANDAGFIPEIWSMKTQVKWYDQTFLPQISNSDYEGEITEQGDKVIIRVIPDITVSDSYEKGQILDIQVPDSTPLSLTINKGHYYNCALDDVDKVQADLDLLNMFTTDAGHQIKIKQESTVLEDIYDDMVAANQGTAAGAKSGDINMGTTASGVSIGKDTVVEKITEMGLVLDEQNVPSEGRWLVAPPWLIQKIKVSDFMDVSLTGDKITPARDGRVGVVDRFTIYASNLLKTASDTVTHWHVLGGHKSGLTFASQIVKSEKRLPSNTFGERVRGLVVYGYEVIKPEALVDLYCKKGS
jgi:hypothetical protein